jgi:phosphatidylglycerol---prolipoprotein diacylglyceryl transferase
MSETSHWVHDLDPFLIQFSENFGIRYYGLAYIAGLLIAFGLHWLASKKGRSPISAERSETDAFILFAFLLAGARLGYIVLYNFNAFSQEPWIIFKVWEGGMSSHGGFIGVVLGSWYISRREGLRMLQFSDLVAPFIPPGFFFGRLANFVNGELWGRVSDVSQAVIFPLSAPEGTPVELIAPRHPSQLYEAALEGLALFLFMQWRFWKTDARKHVGRISGEFFVFYALVRIFCEMFREPDAALILGMSRGSFYSIFLIIAGIGLIAYSHTSGAYLENPNVPVYTPKAEPEDRNKKPKKKSRKNK